MEYTSDMLVYQRITRDPYDENKPAENSNKYRTRIRQKKKTEKQIIFEEKTNGAPTNNK